jgi:hypothetical protein
MDVLLSVGKKACEGFEITLIVLSGIWHSTLLTQQGYRLHRYTPGPMLQPASKPAKSVQTPL